MRRALLLLAVAAAVAVVAGLVIPSSVVRAGGTSLGADELSDELAAISKSPAFQCYLQARQYDLSGDTWPSATGSSSQSFSTDAAVLWANLRASQLVFAQYVGRHDPSAFSPRSLAAARSSYASSITEILQSAYDESHGEFSCAASAPGAATLKTLPAWFVRQQVRGEAALLGLAALVPAQLATPGSTLATWYAQHRAQFDTTCLSDLFVTSQAQADAIVKRIDAGLPVDVAAQRYSKPTGQGHRGGAIGCFSPTSSDWSAVEAYVGSYPVGKASLVQASDPALQGSPTGWYVLVATRRTPNSLSSILPAVESDGSSILATAIQRDAHVTVSPELGTWVTTSLGGTIAPPSSPPTAAVLNAAANTPPT